MDKYECPCGYVYDPAEGDYEHSIDPGTSFADCRMIGYVLNAELAKKFLL